MAAAKPGEAAQSRSSRLTTPGQLIADAVRRQAARDITAFPGYAAEPAALKRESIGVWVLLYLAFFTFLAWLLKHEYWKDVH